MAFDRDNFAKISSGYAHIVSPQMWSYLSLVDPISEFFSPGYFDEVNEESVLVNVGDLFLMQGPVTATIGIVESINPIVIGAAITSEALENESVTSAKIFPGAVGEPQLFDNAVTTNKINDLAVTKAKLSANLQPFSVCVFQSKVSTVGGGTLESFTTPGVQINDFVFATMRFQGASNPIIVASNVQFINKIEVFFSIDPGNDSFILLNAFRTV